MKAYAISPEVQRVIGEANKNLSTKFSFDKATNKWQFNKNGAAALAASIAQQQGNQDAEGIAEAISQLTAKQVGGSGEKDLSLYSVDLPVKAREGITYYDNVTRLSFKMTPGFTARDGKLVQDRIVYPFMDGAQIVYTAKPNGLKEDIVLSRYISDTVRYSYDLQLPDTLQAKLLDDGSVGIYSGNPALFGNISFSGEADKARVMEARKTSSKDHLVFSIPPPFVKDQTGNVGNTRYYLNGNRLTVVADGLKDLKYPLTVDPSVTVTSSTDFENGNNEGEGSITFGNGEIRRGDVSGGTVGTWASADTGTAFGTARAAHNTVTYNGYIYVIGGAVSGGSGATTDVKYAALCTGSNTNGGCTGSTAPGRIGTWTTGNSLTEGRSNNGVTAYNGYIYVIGGSSGGANTSSNVQYSQIGANGAPGTWTNLGNFSTTISNSELVAYNGYLYIIGGCTNIASGTCTAFNGDVYYASINGNGTLSSWTQLSSTPLGAARYGHTSFAYNGYMYVAGGCTAKDVLNVCTTTTTSVEYAKINADGTLDTWSANTALSTARRELKSTISNGYVYITGATGVSSYISYAPIHANGIFGAWASTNTYATSKKDVAMANYNGYLYITGGCTSDVSGCNAGVGYSNVSEYVKIDAAGSVGPNNATSAFDVEASGRRGHATIAAYGYLYVLGGQQEGAGVVNTVKFASINADGTVGTWNTTNSFVTGRTQTAIVVRGGYLYLIGGHRTTATANCTRPGGVGVYYCDDIEWASINPSSGALTWQGSTFVYSAVQARSSLGAAIVNDYLYVIGGVHNNNSTASNEVDYARFNADGSLGTFALTTQQMQSGRGTVAAISHNGKLYAVGSRNGLASEYATPDSNGDITSAWTTTGNSPASSGDRWLTVSYSKGYIYALGGISSGGTFSSVIQIAKINADGTMSNWSSSSNTLSTVREGHSSAVYNDKLYILGGDPSLVNTVASVDYHQIINGGSGTTGSWTSHASMAGSRAAHATASYNGYVYAFGGCSTVASSVNACANANIDSTWTRAAVSSAGVVGAWSAPASLPASTPRFGLSAVAYNGYMYISGGCSATSTDDCTNFQSTVYYAAINSSDGTLGAWSSGGNIATGRFGHSMVVNNGYLYVLGGCSAMGGSACTTFQSDVQYAQIGANGLPGSWSTAGSSFATGRFYQSAVINNNNLYIIGGCSAASGTNCTTIQSDIQRRGLSSSNGTLSGSWVVAGSTPTARYGSSAEAYNGHLYLVGGCSANTGGTCSSHFADVEYIPLAASGLAARLWTKATTDFTNARLLHGTAIVNGYFVLVGGNTSGTFLSETRTSPVSVIDRVGRYSKLVSVNPTTSIAGVYYNGTLDGGSSVEYRVAPSSGVFAAPLAATQGTGSEPTPLCGVGTIYYVQVMITLGDRINAVFGDDSISNVTDVTIYYRINATPPPNLRLNGGKWFYLETQQPLDICRE